MTIQEAFNNAIQESLEALEDETSEEGVSLFAVKDEICAVVTARLENMLEGHPSKDDSHAKYVESSWRSILKAMTDRGWSKEFKMFDGRRVMLYFRPIRRIRPIKEVG